MELAWLSRLISWLSLCFVSASGFAALGRSDVSSRYLPSRPIRPYAAVLRSSAVDTNSESSSSAASSTLSLFSPCKINLFLRIIGKRPDGFPDLASLFQAIGFGDRLELTPLEEANEETNSDSFTCNMKGVPTDSSNLVLRALELMRTKTGVEQYFAANLIKQVPAQAGLGGGSANAATAMWGANELMGRPASLEQVRRGGVGRRVEALRNVICPIAYCFV